ncbi:MAG: acyl carrier protein [Candidatus Aminicenantes bacterium]|nr:acyl carrier protein [Candidatus Aminicenantes bacterium]
MDSRSIVRDYIVDNFIHGDPTEIFCDDDSLLEKGLVDSTGVLELVEFLEDAFGVKVEDGEIVPDNLDSVAKIAAFLKRKTGGPPPPLSSS